MSIESMGRDMRAVPLQPRLNYFELRGNESIKDKIPRYPISEMMNSFEHKSMVNAMINQATSQARNLSKAEELQSQMQTKSIESGIPVNYLQAATGMIPAGLPEEVYAQAEAVRASAVATADRRMVEDSMKIMQQVRADRDMRAQIRATPAPAPLPGHAPGVMGGPIAPMVPHAVMRGGVPSPAPVSETAIDVYAGRGAPVDEASLYVSGPTSPEELDDVSLRRMIQTGIGRVPGGMVSVVHRGGLRLRDGVASVLRMATDRLPGDRGEQLALMDAGRDPEETAHSDALALTAAGVEPRLTRRQRALAAEGNRVLGASPGEGASAPPSAPASASAPPTSYGPENPMLLFGPRTAPEPPQGYQLARRQDMSVLAPQERTSTQVPGRTDMLLGSRGEASEDTAAFKANAQALAGVGLPRPIAFALARVVEYQAANGLSFDDAMRMVGGEAGSVFTTPVERRWLQVFGERIVEVGVQRAAMDATKAAQEIAYEVPIEDDAPSSSARDTRGLDWRRTLYKMPALHFGHLLYKHPDLHKLMDDMIGKNRVTMKHIKDIYDKLQDNEYYREFLNIVRIEIAKNYGDEYYDVMNAPPPQTMTAKTPRMVSSGPSGGGGAIALRSGMPGGRGGSPGTYL